MEREPTARARYAGAPDHDPDQPLLREGALGARPRGDRLRRGAAHPGRPRLARAAGRRRAHRAGPRHGRRGAGRLDARSSNGSTAATRAPGSTRSRWPGEVRRIEDWLDEGLGPDGRLWMYDSTLPVLREHAALGARRACRAGSARFFVGFGWALDPVIRRYLGVDAAASRAALTSVEGVFDEVAGDARRRAPVPTGERFTAADLTFGALSAAGARAARLRLAAAAARRHAAHDGREVGACGSTRRAASRRVSTPRTAARRERPLERGRRG